jgi:hypothetical protein
LSTLRRRASNGGETLQIAAKAGALAWGTPDRRWS